jgi:hypothetical protein
LSDGNNCTHAGAELQHSGIDCDLIELDIALNSNDISTKSPASKLLCLKQPASQT